MPHENRRRRPRSHAETDHNGPQDAMVRAHGRRQRHGTDAPTPTFPKQPTKTSPLPPTNTLPVEPTPTNQFSPTQSPHSAPTPTPTMRTNSIRQTSTTLSPALAACWSSLLVPRIRASSAASSSSSSTGSTSAGSVSSISSSFSSSSSSSSSGSSAIGKSKSPTPALTRSFLTTESSSISQHKQPRLHYSSTIRHLYASAHAHKTSGEDEEFDDNDIEKDPLAAQLNPMPRRKRKTTRPLHLEVPALADAVAHSHDPDEGHLIFRVHGEAIISPRSIRKSLMETDLDMDGNVRERKGSVSISWEHHSSNGSNSSSNSDGGDESTTAHSTNTQDGTTTKASKTSAATSPRSGSTTTVAVMGPKRPDASSHRPRKDPYESDPSIPASDAALSQLTGAQLWVHRLLATHQQTLRTLGVAREAFPNTKLSLKQLETVIRPVIALCNMMTPTQFGIREPSPTMARTMSEVHYWKLWESDTIDVGIFFMPPGGVIPLHNHPGMSVVTRVLYGSAQVTSYDLVPKSELASLPADEVEAGKDDIKWGRVSREGDFVAECTMWLDPRRFNLHHIRANDQIGCALLDIMIPPYDNAERDCHHFQIMAERILEDNQERIVKMLESVQPDNHNGPNGGMMQM